MRARLEVLGQVVAGALLLALLPSAGTAADPHDLDDLDDAVSHPRKDTVYPAAGHREVDALSYDLDLDWNRTSRTLTGRATIVFRATATAPRVSLDLGAPLRPTRVRFGGRRVGFEHEGKDLVIDRRIVEDHRYTLRIDYRGQPKAVRWPTERSDGNRAGWLVSRNGQVATLQEPYGAFTWYPVNDHPSDKAFYSVTITAPRGWTGVSNGELVSSKRAAGRTVTRWRMDKPAASYLVTVAIGDYRKTTDTSSSGVPITYWTPAGSARILAKVRETASALDWLEAKLGPYPFSTLGVVVVRSDSAMETQSTITLGNGDYPLSKPVIVHELAHQWYGDLVTPTDWSDFWMNEGMAMHLQDAWSAEHAGRALFAPVDDRLFDAEYLRSLYGPPARYDAHAFGMSNVYYGAELMWDDVLRQVGWDRYWQLVRAWPQAHAYGNATYDQIVRWWSARTDLSRSFFDKWLVQRKQPRRIALAFPGASGATTGVGAGPSNARARLTPERGGVSGTFPWIRSALVKAAQRLDTYAADHDGVYPQFDQGSGMVDRIVNKADQDAVGYYVPDESRSSYCLVPALYYVDDLGFAFDSGTDDFVDAPDHRYPAGSVCAQTWPVLERAHGLQVRTSDLVALLGRARGVPTSLARLREAREADHGYLFPIAGPGFRIADYQRIGSGDGADVRVCVLDERGGSVTFTSEPRPQLRTFPYGSECTYAE